MKNSARGDSSTGSELKAVEEACREASRTVEPCDLCVSVVKLLFPLPLQFPFGHESRHVTDAAAAGAVMMAFFAPASKWART